MLYSRSMKITLSWTFISSHQLFRSADVQDDQAYQFQVATCTLSLLMPRAGISIHTGVVSVSA